MRILYLATDAYGGRGGIACYTQSVIDGLCAHASGKVTVVALPRRMPDPPGPLPGNLVYVTDGVADRFHFMKAFCRVLVHHWKFDLVICGHILLIPFAYLASRLNGCPCLLLGYGIDVWQPTASRLKNALARRVDLFVTISRASAERFCSWSGHRLSQVPLLPPCIRAGDFSPGIKPQDLLDRYRLHGRRVLMTLARLDASEKYKGFDEILELLPDLSTVFPNLSYLIVGDGNDRCRLEEKAGKLGVSDRVVFAGWIDDSEKVSHYRLADAFAMPGSGEGFGIVYLEALACGLPVLASALDGSRDAVRDGELGMIVDPRDREALKEALIRLLSSPSGHVPAGLSYFFEDAFRARLSTLLDTISGAAPRS